MKYLANAFALSMLPEGAKNWATFETISKEKVSKMLSDGGFQSAIGHQDTARVLENLLRLDIPVERISLSLKDDDKLIVAQYIGPRLPEGATSLPEGAEIKFFEISVWGLEKQLENERRDWDAARSNCLT